MKKVYSISLMMTGICGIIMGASGLCDWRFTPFIRFVLVTVDLISVTTLVYSMRKLYGKKQ